MPKTKIGKQTKKKKKPTAKDLMKLEIAEELGLLDKYNAVGWAGLSAQEAGAIGGIMSHRLRASRAAKQATDNNES